MKQQMLVPFVKMAGKYGSLYVYTRRQQILIDSSHIEKAQFGLRLVPVQGLHVKKGNKGNLGMIIIILPQENTL